MDAIPFKSFLKRLERDIEQLPRSHQLAFAASCCERAYPNYVSFSRKSHWGGPAVLRAVLDIVWDLVEGSNRSFEDLDELENKCELVTPDLDDFSAPDIDVLAAAAQEAAFMVQLLLQLSRGKQQSHVKRIVTFAADTIDMYVQVISHLDAADRQLDEKVANHPLMVQETCRQEGDALTLARIGTHDDLREFRRYATHPLKSNIGLAVPVR